MTPHGDLVARLELALNETLLGRGIKTANVQRNYRLSFADADRLMKLRAACFDALGALAALPPPADPLYEYCPSCRRLGPLFGLTAIRSEETGGRHCIACYGKTESRLLPLWTAPPPPADPPALVALVREWQRKQRGCDIENTAAAYAELDIAEAELLAYPLPAAPPVVEPVPIPEPHQRAAAAFRALATPVPMSEAERTADDPDYGLTPAAPPVTSAREAEDTTWAGAVTYVRDMAAAIRAMAQKFVSDPGMAELAKVRAEALDSCADGMERAAKKARAAAPPVTDTPQGRMCDTCDDDGPGVTPCPECCAIAAPPQEDQ